MLCVTPSASDREVILCVVCTEKTPLVLFSLSDALFREDRLVALADATYKPSVSCSGSELGVLVIRR